MEAQLVDPATPWPFTTEWYAGRDRAAHLEQPVHQPRLEMATSMVAHAVADYEVTTVVDLGCGDGGLLSLLARTHPDVKAWGYDLQPANVEAARNIRHVDVCYADFLDPPGAIRWADCAVITECLEHLRDPHAAVRLIGSYSQFIVASSPAFETDQSHDPLHAWCWNEEGYRDLMGQAGFEVVDHRVTSSYPGFQVILGVQP